MYIYTCICIYIYILFKKETFRSINISSVTVLFYTLSTAVMNTAWVMDMGSDGAFKII